MAKVQCQHCQSYLEDFLSVCPYCKRKILAVTAIRFLGEGLSEYLRIYVKDSPQLAKKKTTLYLKMCQRFVCDSELALLNVRACSGSFDHKTTEAIKDVIGSHQQHMDNLNDFLEIIGDEPLLAPVAKKIVNTSRRIDVLLEAWQINNSPVSSTVSSAS